MLKLINKLVKDKKEYKELMERVDALPEEYGFVFEKMHRYMWGFAGGDGSDMLNTQRELIELFEMSSADGKHVLDVTGKDVIGFCDEILHDTKKWTDKYRNKLNHDVLNQLEKDNEKSK